ncbi:cold shock domain-containing protein [Methanobrevibacter sp.]|uniref:cold shock domain-containing protein n=1 Tax=Methanobrevibacter sp. TaxID=66852 RepID=UPI00386CFE6A
MNEFKKDLITAYEFKTVGKNKQALEIYEKCYKEHPEEFSFNQKNDYAWTIYKTRIAFFSDEDELFENVEFITELVEQRNFNKSGSCVYTSSIFKVLNHLKSQNDFASMIPWLGKLDPDLLDEKPFRKYGRINKSHRQQYYDWASMAYYQNMEYEKCIEVSKTALNSLKRFIDEGDTWLRWRIAKSLTELGRLKEALTYYEKVIEVRHDWYMYRDIAEIYLRLKKHWISLDYLCPAILSDEPNKVKAGIYYTCYKVFKSSNMPMAIKHAQLYYLLRSESSYPVAYEIDELNFDETQLNRRELEREIRDLWIRYKFKNQKMQHGTVKSFNEERKFGFIKAENDDEIFFHKSEFEGENVYIGQLVSFYTEESFDKSKNRRSIKAVNVRGEQ